MNLLIECPCEYYTATILEWKNLLKPEKYKTIILNSFSHLVKNKQVLINGFVIMDNHIHVIWQALGNNTSEKLRLSFMRYTAQQIKFDLQKFHPEVLKRFYVGAADREYQFWERKPLSIELHNQETFLQKLKYIHENPVKAGLCRFPADYKYSSAKFYEDGTDEFGWLTHFRD